MPIYLYWGDDDFALQQMVKALRDRTLDPPWASFNYDKFSGDLAETIVQGLNQAMTPPFGSGDRFVWMAESSLFQRCPEALLRELERTLPGVPDTTVLVFTTAPKPDGRLKSTKLLQKVGEIQEFSTIPPWKTDLLLHQARQAAQAVGVSLTPGAVQLLVDAVGNHSRQLYEELEKLRLYAGDNPQPLPEAIVATLVTPSTQNSLQLAAQIRQGNTSNALGLITELFNINEPALRIGATLVGQFRTWLWVKLMMEAGERNEREIARAAEVSNPKRIYFLQQEVRSIALGSLLQALPLLLELEFSLKQGADPLLTLQTKTIELCQLFKG